MLTNVLVPLDGSEVAERALEYARQITDPNGGKITLLTAIDVPEYTMMAYYPTVVAYEGSTENITEKMMPQAKDYLYHAAEDLKRQGYHVKVEAIIGEAANAIVEHANKIQAEAIIMSTHGRSGISRWLFGSVASKVLESAQCPVFIVPVRR